MTTLADLRDRLRKDLHDTDDTAYRWTDEQLDRHIESALSELSLAIPQELQATIATINGSRQISLASLTALVAVERVEYPVDHYPASYPEFATWGDALTLHTASEPAGDDAIIFYTARHTLDAEGTSLSSEQADLVAMGAGALAALEQSVFAADRIVTGDRVAERYGEWGRARLTAFRQLLHHYGRRNRVRHHRLVRPA